MITFGNLRVVGSAVLDDKKIIRLYSPVSADPYTTRHVSISPFQRYKLQWNRLKWNSTLWRIRSHVIIADNNITTLFSKRIYRMHFAPCSHHHISRYEWSRISIPIPIARFASRLDDPCYTFSNTCNVSTWEPILYSLTFHMRCWQQVSA